MFNARLWLVLAIFLAYDAGTAAQQRTPAAQRGSGRVVLDVVVTGKAGPVSGLRQQAFTLLDNKIPQTIGSFRAVDGRQEPIRIILLVDAVNADYSTVAYERDQIDKFLRADQGNLVHPILLAALTDGGTQIVKGFSDDGNALSASLDDYTVGLRNIRRSGGFYDAAELFDRSLQGLHQLAALEAPLQGRKLILWVSPGWPLLSGPNVELDGKERERLFGDVVDFSTQLLKGDITLYSIDPLGTADAVRNFFWGDFVKGISKPSEVQAGDLALQVLATQSGGLALNSNNNISALLQECVADIGAYYELSFDPPPGDKPNEYHHLEVRVAQKGMTARTRQGYYLQP